MSDFFNLYFEEVDEKEFESFIKAFPKGGDNKITSETAYICSPPYIKWFKQNGKIVAKKKHGF